jgi:hypothetical protein
MKNEVLHKGMSDCTGKLNFIYFNLKEQTPHPYDYIAGIDCIKTTHIIW